jgi:hypothetical protein
MAADIYWTESVRPGNSLATLALDICGQHVHRLSLKAAHPLEICSVVRLHNRCASLGLGNLKDLLGNVTSIRTLLPGLLLPPSPWPIVIVRLSRSHLASSKGAFLCYENYDLLGSLAHRSPMPMPTEPMQWSLPPLTQ